jgi:hypothetical protein
MLMMHNPLLFVLNETELEKKFQSIFISSKLGQ